MAPLGPVVPPDPDALRRQVFAASLTAPLGEASEHLREDFRSRLRGVPRSLEKGGPPVHFTASALVVDTARRRIALTLHRKAHRWMQFGGHIELSDASFLAAARREAQEESGLSGLVPVLPGPVGLDIHGLGEAFGACREHWDVRFLLTVGAGGEDLVVSDESEQVAWFPLDRLPSAVVEDLLPLLSSLSASGLLRSPAGRASRR